MHMRRSISRILLVFLLLCSAFSFVACTGPSDGSGGTKTNSNAFVLSKESAIKKLTDNEWESSYYRNDEDTPGEKRRIKFKINYDKKTIACSLYSSDSPYTYSDISWDYKKKQLLFSHEDYPGTGYRFTFLDNGKIKFEDCVVVGYELITKFDN